MWWYGGRDVHSEIMTVRKVWILVSDSCVYCSFCVSSSELLWLNEALRLVNFALFYYMGGGCCFRNG